MKEIWRDIEGYEGMYQVSDLGRVRSLERYDCRGRIIKGKMLTLRSDGYGYYHVGLNKNGKERTVKVHILVANAFLPNPEGKLEIDHIDTVKTNNNASNLQWATRSENMDNPITKKNCARYHESRKSTKMPPERVDELNDGITEEPKFKLISKQKFPETCAYQERLIEMFNELAERCSNIEGKGNEIHCSNAYVKGSISTHVLPEKVWESSQTLIDKLEKAIPERFIVANGGVARPVEDLQNMVKKARQDGIPRNLYELFTKYTTEQERLFQVYVPIMLIDISFDWVNEMAGYIKEKRLPFHKWLRPLAQHKEEYEIAIKLAIGVSMFHSLKRRTAELGISIYSDIIKMLYSIDNVIMKTSPSSSHHLAMSFAEVALILIELAKGIDLDFEKSVSERSGITYKGKENYRIERIKELLYEIVRELCGQDEFNPIDLNQFPIIKSACQAIKNRLTELEFAF